MDSEDVLKSIHKNLNMSLAEFGNRYDEIFSNYYRYVTKGSALQAEEYLALHMGELDLDFTVYHKVFAEELRKKGETNAADLWDKLEKGFVDSLKHFKIRRFDFLILKTKVTAENLITSL